MLLAVDPGHVTGFWWIDPENDVIDGGQLEHEQALFWMDALFESRRGITVVCENFQVTQRTVMQHSNRQWSLEQIGVLRWWLLKERYDSLVMQSPSSAKSFATNEKLKRIGWYKKGKEHCRDAARHALVYATKNGIIDPKTLLPKEG